MDSTGERICKRQTALNALKSPHVDVWRRCFDHTFPLRGSGFYGDTVTAEDGLSKRARLTDSTATDAVRMLASQIMDGMTPANAIWFELDVGDESDAEKRWLSDAAKFIWENIHNSNFDSVGFESIIDVICAGFFIMFIDEAKDGGYLFAEWPIAECSVASSVAGGPVDTVYRSFEYTAEQAVSAYGDDVSEDIKKAIADNKGDTKFKFVHAIEPRKNFVVNAKLAKNMPFASVHVEEKTKKTVRESGFHEFPCAVPRWMMIPGSAYAVGPVYDALPDISMINEVKRMELASLDLAIAGMWVAEDDGVLNPGTIKIGARKVIVANSVDSIKPLQTGADFHVAFMSEDRIQMQIRKMLLADHLQPQDGPQMTATEVHVRVQMVRQLLGPIYGRFQSEYLQPLIERCFGIALRAGALGPAPESLRDRDYNIKYVSPLARAQKLEEVNAIDQWVAGTAAYAEIAPQALDIIDFDAATRVKAEAYGVPNKAIRNQDDTADVRVQREEQEQEQQQQQIAGEVAAEGGKAAVKQALG
jgi:hypothetical protein